MTAVFDPEILRQEAQLAAIRKEFMTLPAELVLTLLEQAADALDSARLAEGELSDARANIKDLEGECAALTDILSETEGLEEFSQ